MPEGTGFASGAEQVIIDGQLQPASAAAGGAGRTAGISPFDRGLHFGDGLFETIACRAGRARFLSLHLERLAHGCERLCIRLPDAAGLRRTIERAAAAGDTGLLKVIVTRGEATRRGYAWSGREAATSIVLRYAWPEENPAAGRDGIAVRCSSVRLGENPALAGMKHLNRLEQVLARSAVPAEDAPELLLFSRSGWLISGTMSNLFLVRDGRLATPRLDLCGVAGVMRRVVLREAGRAGIGAEECALGAEDLARATEVFLTNARIGIWPVSRIDSRPLAPGPVTRRIQELIAPMLEVPVDA